MVNQKSTLDIIAYRATLGIEPTLRKEDIMSHLVTHIADISVLLNISGQTIPLPQDFPKTHFKRPSDPLQAHLYDNAFLNIFAPYVRAELFPEWDKPCAETPLVRTTNQDISLRKLLWKHRPDKLGGFPELFAFLRADQKTQRPLLLSEFLKNSFGVVWCVGISFQDEGRVYLQRLSTQKGEIILPKGFCYLTSRLV